MHERVTQQLAGHADSRMTREIYTHVTNPMFDGAATAIEQAVRDARGSSSGSNDDRDDEGQAV